MSVWESGGEQDVLTRRGRKSLGFCGILLNQSARRLFAMMNRMSLRLPTAAIEGLHWPMNLVMRPLSAGWV